jgi:hypothetical protein
MFFGKRLVFLWDFFKLKSYDCKHQTKQKGARMGDEKKNLFDKAIDALTNRDEKEAAVKAQAEAAAAQKEAAALRVQMEAQQAAAARAASEKAAVERAAALNEAAEKAAADQAAALKAAAEKAAAAAPKKGVVTTRSLRVRKEHSTTSEVVAGLVDGNEITILETWSDGKNTWARLENGWAAMLYNGETFIKFLQ